MPHRVVFAPEAQAQLLELYRYIAEASPATALRFTDAIVAHCEDLADFPLRGPAREDLRPGLRTLAFPRPRYDRLRGQRP
jgi:toxin ParE1/3/4